MRAGRLVWLGAVLAVACGGSASTPGAGAGGGGDQNSAAGNGGRSASGAGGGGASGSTQASLGGAGGMMSSAGNPSGGAGNPSGGAAGAGGAAVRNVFVDQLGNLAGCFPRALPTDTDAASPTFGQVLCQVVEASAVACDCGKPGREPADPSLVTPIRKQLQASGGCGDASGQTACASFCMCEIVQEIGAAAQACQTDPVAAAADSSVPPGFCYASDPTSAALAQCPSSQKQKLLFVSPTASPTPSPGDVLFLACASALSP